jgi:hypothetical protein
MGGSVIFVASNIIAMKKQLLFIILFITCTICNAQIDLQCSGRDMHSIYLFHYGGSNAFYRIDSVDTSPTNPIWLDSIPGGNFGGGISINNNLDSLAGPETMYFVDLSSHYYFWNGTSWSNTGHTSGSGAALNPGGTSNYIFNLDGNGNSLYRYDGTGSGTLLLSNLNTNGVAIYDVATDNQGNFYLFYTNLQKIIAYDPSGIPIDSFTTSGFPTGGDPGIAILGNNIYANTLSALYKGTKIGSNINFTQIKNLSFLVGDIAACPEAGNPLAVFKDLTAPHFAIYPNPAHSVAIIKMINTATLEITDCLGRLRKSIDVRGLNEYHLSVTDLEPGAYIINAVSKNKSGVRSTLIVQ